MAQQQTCDAKQLLVFKLDVQRNTMKFLRGFRRVAEPYHVTELVYDNLTDEASQLPIPARGGDFFVACLFGQQFLAVQSSRVGVGRCRDEAASGGVNGAFVRSRRRCIL